MGPLKSRAELVLADAEGIGEVSRGLQATLTGLAGLVASSLGGVLWTAVGPWATFALGAAFALAAAAVLAAGRRPVGASLAVG
jgi:hypothetical protein